MWPCAHAAVWHFSTAPIRCQNTAMPDLKRGRRRIEDLHTHPAAAPDAAPKRGRPRIEDRGKTLAATRPWEALGMSERTWYRRQAERRRKGES